MESRSLLSVNPLAGLALQPTTFTSSAETAPTAYTQQPRATSADQAMNAPPALTTGSRVPDVFVRPQEPQAAASPSLVASAPPAGKLPYGATSSDTSQYMIGDVWVTVVLLDSNGAVDAQSENWTSTEIGQVKSEIQEGLKWWEDTFQTAQAVAPRNNLSFKLDFTYADSPVATKYEPIKHSSSDQALWIDDFLNRVGYNSSSSIFTDLDRWNNDQRVAHNTDWAYTIFVVDSSADTDGMFSNGSFAYTYLGGPFTMMTYDNDGWGISNMGQVTAHETGHIFYALDEYPNSSAYSEYSGYYNTQNTNAYDGNPNLSSRVSSIMAESSLQRPAYTNHTSSPSSLQMLGWKDSDRDGVFDVLDVPLSLTGSGAYNATTKTYDFTGTSSAQTLANLNPMGSRHAITTNTVDVLQYRLDGGAWVDGKNYGDFSANVSQSVPVTAGKHTIEFRTMTRENGVTSAVWSATFDTGTTTTPPTTSTVFQQSSTGLLSIEAEHYSGVVQKGTDNWVTQTNSSASGGVAMTTTPNNGTVYNTGYTTYSSRLDYKVNFLQAGTYYVWVRGYAPGGGSDDSIHAGLDGQALASSDRINGFSNTGYRWSRGTMDGVVAKINVTTPGVHTINFWMREDGFVFDKFVLALSSSYAPSGTGPTESAKTTVISAAAPLASPTPANSAALADALWTEAVASRRQTTAPPKHRQAARHDFLLAREYDWLA